MGMIIAINTRNSFLLNLLTLNLSIIITTPFACDLYSTNHFSLTPESKANFPGLLFGYYPGPGLMYFGIPEP